MKHARAPEPVGERISTSSLGLLQNLPFAKQFAICPICRPLGAVLASQNTFLRGDFYARLRLGIVSSGWGFVEEKRMRQLRHRVVQRDTLEARLAERARELRNEAAALSPCAAQEALIKLARYAETSAHLSARLSSPGLMPH